jgi:hypothetical protein
MDRFTSVLSSEEAVFEWLVIVCWFLVVGLGGVVTGVGCVAGLVRSELHPRELKQRPCLTSQGLSL